MNYAVSSPDAKSESFPITPLTRSWNQLFEAYRSAFLSADRLQGRNFARGFNTIDFDAMGREIVALGRDSSCGDVLLLDVQLSPGQYDRARERLADVIFRAGYEAPLIWASRDVLLNESRRSRLLTRFLPSQALGFPPSLGLIDVEKIAEQKGRLVAVGVRGKQTLPDERNWKVSVVLPAFNEAGTIDAVLEQILAKQIPGATIELCIVESNSTDGTREKVLAYKDHPKVKIILEERPEGKGHAVRAGLQQASGDIVIIQDADLEYDINDYEKLIDPLKSYKASFVLGSRHSVGESAWQIRSFEGQQGIARILNFGHIFFTWLLNFTFRQRLRDPFTMFKVFRRDAIQNMCLECNRFDFDIELAGKLIRAGRLPIEIDVKYVSRSFDEGKKVSFFRDPPTWFAACAKHRFSRVYLLAPAR
jgi:hypothetical protein